MHTTKNYIYHLIAILTVGIWGLTFISTKVLIEHGLSPQEIFLLRFLMAYLGIWFISPRKLFADNWKDELWLLWGGVTGGSFYFFTENTALEITLATNVAFIVCTAPLLTTILSLLIYKKEKATAGLVGGSLLALVGVALVVYNGHFILKISPLGDFLTLLAAFSWAFYSLIMKKMSGRYRTTFITRKIFFYGILTILPAGGLDEPSFSGCTCFSGLLCGVEHHFEAIGYGAGFQLHLFESAFHADRFRCPAGRTVHCNVTHGSHAHIGRCVLGGKEIKGGEETYGHKKKEYRCTPTFVNLKSNTMKNTLQRYGLFGNLQIKQIKKCVL